MCLPPSPGIDMESEPHLQMGMVSIQVQNGVYDIMAFHNRNVDALLTLYYHIVWSLTVVYRMQDNAMSGLRVRVDHLECL